MHGDGTGIKVKSIPKLFGKAGNTAEELRWSYSCHRIAGLPRQTAQSGDDVECVGAVSSEPNSELLGFILSHSAWTLPECSVARRKGCLELNFFNVTTLRSHGVEFKQ
jgi:hypothetical protein